MSIKFLLEKQLNLNPDVTIISCMCMSLQWHESMPVFKCFAFHIVTVSKAWTVYLPIMVMTWKCFVSLVIPGLKSVRKKLDLLLYSLHSPYFKCDFVESSWPDLQKKIFLACLQWYFRCIFVSVLSACFQWYFGCIFVSMLSACLQCGISHSLIDVHRICMWVIPSEFFLFILIDVDLCVGWMQHNKVWPFVCCCNH